MLGAARNWLGLVLGAALFAHEALTTKDPIVMTAAAALMGFRYALNGGGKGKAS